MREIKKRETAKWDGGEGSHAQSSPDEAKAGGCVLAPGPPLCSPQT